MISRATMRAAVVATAIAAVWALVPEVARAQQMYPNLHNADMMTPAAGANDYEVTYTASTPFTIGQLWVGPSDNPHSSVNAFPPATSTQGEFVDVSPSGSVTYNGNPLSNISVSGNGTNNVSVMYSGASFSPGQWTHVGAFGTGGVQAGIANAYWTINGVPVASADGHQAGVRFTGTSTEWLIVRVTDYDSSNDVIGHNWTEQQATGFTLTGNPGVDLDVSYATMVSPTEIPLDQLNENLTGFGAESPITTLGATPEPSTLVLASLGFLGVLVYARRRGRKTGE